MPDPHPDASHRLHRVLAVPGASAMLATGGDRATLAVTARGRTIGLDLSRDDARGLARAMLDVLDRSVTDA